MFIILFLFLATGLFSVKEKKFHQRISTYFQKDFPKKFKCKIIGDALKKSIKQIPKDAIIDAKNIHIKLIYHKKYGTRIKLMGVNEVFEDRFSYMEKIFEFIKPFVQKQSYKQFNTKYKLFKASRSMVRLRKKYTKNAYLEFKLKKNLIIQVKEYKNDKSQMSMWIKYKKIKNFVLPVFFKIFLYDDKKMRTLRFRLKDFNFMPKITEEDFLG